MPQPDSDTLAEYDVVVMGSGSAALAAALTAAAQNASVLVIEKAPVLGGTSAMSGAGTWIPANHHMRDAGYEDSPEEALTYIQAAAPPGWGNEEAPLWRAFCEEAPAMLKFVEMHSPLNFKLIHHPDIYMELPGAKDMGRMLVPGLLRKTMAGAWKNRIRRSTKPQIFDYDEIMTGDALIHPIKTVMRLFPKLALRLMTGTVGMGSALIVGLVRGCVDHGCMFWTNTAVTGLSQNEAGRVTGVEIDQQGKTHRVGARKGVIIASGGFEWDKAMLEEHICPEDYVLRGSPRTNSGDGQKIAAAIGARLTRMDQANLNPMVMTKYQGQRLGMPLALVDYPAHCIIVDRHGSRFTSEGDRNLGIELIQTDQSSGESLHLPAWRVFDSNYAREHRFFMGIFNQPKPHHLRRAETIADLATQIDIESAALEETIARFNRFVRDGSDFDFHRGESEFEKSHAPMSDDTNPALGALDTPPYFATPYYVGILGTKGGPRTNERGQVIHESGSVIPGLYCAGVAMANPIGSKNVGAGTTIGPNMTWGYICANDAVNHAPDESDTTA